MEVGRSPTENAERAVPFSAAVSTHPVSSHATGEVIGQVIEEVGSHPDVALLLATPGHAGALEDVAGTVRRLLGPTLLIGATAAALAGQGADRRGGPAMGLWAGITGPIQPIHLPGQVARPAFGVSGALVLGQGVVGLDGGVGQEAGGDGLLEVLGGPPVQGRAVGALSSDGPLLIDDRRLAAGAVGVIFGPTVRFEAVTATDWRPIGPEMAVSDSDPERDIILGLDGVPALERLHRLATDEVPAEEIEWINRRLGIGPQTRLPGAGDGDGDDPASSVVEVRGGDRSNGAIAAGAFPVGSQVRFWVGGDPESGLRRALGGRAADSVVVFAADPAARGYPPTAADLAGDPAASGPPSPSAPSRTGRLPAAGDGYPGDPGAFEAPADAPVIADALGVQRVFGMVAPAQIGPLGGRLRLRRRDATMALLSDSPTAL
jgi:small ligand-binding sensory domain FIST